ncbi:MAG: hypothetical protein WA130_07830 [Candidatus Methanoperedens sp.]
MAFDVNVKTLVMINLTVQILLMILLSYSSFIVRKKDLRKHCSINRIAVIIQIAAILFFMLPSMLGFVKNGILSDLEILFHHTLGIVLIGLWIYINLAYSKIIKGPDNFKLFMRSAYILWTLAFIVGLHIYIRFYL